MMASFSARRASTSRAEMSARWEMWWPPSSSELYSMEEERLEARLLTWLPVSRRSALRHVAGRLQQLLLQHALLLLHGLPAAQRLQLRTGLLTALYTCTRTDCPRACIAQHAVRHRTAPHDWVEPARAGISRGRPQRLARAARLHAVMCKAPEGR